MNEIPYRVLVYGPSDEILYDRLHTDFELWKLAPGLSLRVRDLEGRSDDSQETRQDD